MNRRLRTRGNVSIDLFNDTRDNTSGYKESMIRFELVKRLPFASFSHGEFMRKSAELIKLVQKYQRLEPKVEILGFNSPQDCLALHGLDGGQDDATAHKILDGRNSYSFEEFTQKDYERNIEPELILKSEEKDSFMICLTATPGIETNFAGINAPSYYSFFKSKNLKRRLQFYGQTLAPELFEAIVERYHKPGLTHSLSHKYKDSILNYLQCAI
ncbi:MAG: hypothetical protein Q8L29_00645 [archaeon]|nr:hypothetical protein [archaeon]